MAFFSGELYRDVAEYWRGISFAYLALLLAICWIITFAGLQVHLSAWLEEQGPSVISAIPEMRFEDEKLIVDVEQPYTIEHIESGEQIAVIDTTGEITSLDQIDAPILLTETAAHIKNNTRETRVYNYTGLDGFTIDQAFLELWMGRAASWFGVIVFPFVWIFSFFWRCFIAFIYAILGFVFSKVLMTDLTFPAIFSLAIVAMTPALLLESVIELSGSNPLGVAGWFLWIFVTCGFLFFAVLSTKSGAPPPRRGFPARASAPMR